MTKTRWPYFNYILANTQNFPTHTHEWGSTQKSLKKKSKSL